MSWYADMRLPTKQDAAANPKKARRSGRGRKYLQQSNTSSAMLALPAGLIRQEWHVFAVLGHKEVHA